MRPAGSIAGHRGKAPWRFELDSGPQSITHGQTDQGSTAAVVHNFEIRIHRELNIMQSKARRSLKSPAPKDAQKLRTH